MEYIIPPLITSIGITPFVATIDQFIVKTTLRNTKTNDSIINSIKQNIKIYSPKYHFRGFLKKESLLIQNVYITTFTTYNLMKHNNYNDTEILFGTTIANKE